MRNLQAIWDHYQRSGSLQKTSIKFGLSREGLRKILIKSDHKKYNDSIIKRIKKCDICKTRKPKRKGGSVCKECEHMKILLGGSTSTAKGVLLYKFHPKAKLSAHPKIRYNKTIVFNRLIVELAHNLFPAECFDLNKKLKGERIFVWRHPGKVLKPEYNVLQDFSIVIKSDMINTPLKKRGVNFSPGSNKIRCTKEHIVDLLTYIAMFTLPHANIVFNLIEQLGNLEITVQDLEYYTKMPCKSIRNTSDPYQTKGRFFLSLDIIEIFRKALLHDVFLMRNPKRNIVLLKHIRTTIIHELEHYSGLLTERPTEKMTEEMRVLRIIKNLRRKIGRC